MAVRPPPSPSSVAPGYPEASEVSLSGNLSRFSVFELLQSLHFLRKSGALEITSTDPQRPEENATLVICAEGLAHASCGALRGREAVLTALWWTRGRFTLRDFPVNADERTIPLQELLLDGVRLEDEVESRGDVLPERSAPLALRSEKLAEPILHLAAVQAVVDHLRARPGSSRQDLEAELPFAPVTLGFTVARLCEEGAVAARAADRAGSSPRLRRASDRSRPTRIARMIRLLVAFKADQAETTLQLVADLRERISATAGSALSLDPAGLSFLRLRLPSDRHLSISFLPLGRRNRFTFESLAADLELAMFVASTDPEAGTDPEVAEWAALIPERVVTLHATQVREGTEQLLARLRDLGVSTLETRSES